MDEIISFNTSSPEYAKLKKILYKLNKKTQDEYTDKIDAIAEKKLKKYLKELE